MRPEPALTRDAHADILQAADYYNTQRPGLGFDFLNEFEDTISLIREAPLLFTVVGAPIRRALSIASPTASSTCLVPTTPQNVVLGVVDLLQDPEVVRRTYRR
jgi:hypothetical protein